MRVEQLRALARKSGPFASVYLDASHDTEDAATRDELRRQAVDRRLRAEGVDDSTIEATRDAVLARPPVGQAGRAVISAHGSALLVEDLPFPPASPDVRVSELPYLLPLLSATQPSIPHVVVVATKVDARLRAVDRDGEISDAETVRGHDHPVHHVPGGGYAHRSMENRAEQTVRQNAKSVAEHAVRLVEQVDAELLVLAGTVSARSPINAELPEFCARLVAELDVDANNAGLDSAEVTSGVARLLAQRQAGRDTAALDRLHTGQAHGTACEGLAEVAEALRMGRADTVLVTDPVLADQTVWLGPDRSQIAATQDELPGAQADLVRRRAISGRAGRRAGHGR